MDDIALFSDCPRQVLTWKRGVIDRLAELRLTIHAAEAQLAPVTSAGIPWLGFVVYPDHQRLKRRNAATFRRRLERNLELYLAGRLTFAELDTSIGCWTITSATPTPRTCAAIAGRATISAKDGDALATLA